MEDQTHGALAVKQTPEQVEALALAMWDLLDDMGKDGTSVCRYNKAKARIAYEPFREADHTGDDGVDMPLAEAEALVRDTDEGV